jgi:hypothetical protein
MSDGWKGSLLGSAALLVALTGPEEQPIEVNPHEVVSIRPQRGNLASGIRCLIHTTDGKYISVIEDCMTVSRKLSEGK